MLPEQMRGPALYDREELYTGTADEAIAVGLDIPLARYRFMPYGSSSLLLSIAAAPLPAPGRLALRAAHRLRRAARAAQAS